MGGSRIGSCGSELALPELAAEAETGSVAGSVDPAGRHVVSAMILYTTTMALTYFCLENLDLLTIEVLSNVGSGCLAGLVRCATPAHVVAVVLLRDSAGSTVGKDER